MGRGKKTIKMQGRIEKGVGDPKGTNKISIKWTAHARGAQERGKNLNIERSLVENKQRSDQSGVDSLLLNDASFIVSREHIYTRIHNRVHTRDDQETIVKENGVEGAWKKRSIQKLFATVVSTGTNDGKERCSL